jgi:hypothetical protein
LQNLIHWSDQISNLVSAKTLRFNLKMETILKKWNKPQFSTYLRRSVWCSNVFLS